MYAFTAILILPINSCLNPLVFTDIIDKVCCCETEIDVTAIQPCPDLPGCSGEMGIPVYYRGRFICLS